jgi:pimeloyl-ACP methyl ester carboxylesterase
MKSEKQRLRINGRTRLARYWRGGTGRTLVLLQGGMADAELHWSSVWNELALTHDVIAPDIPGLGESEGLRRPDWTNLCAWLATLLDDAGVSDATVIGNSFGGTYARAFSLLAPSRVTGLVCVNGGQFIEIPAWMKLVLRTPAGGIYWRRRTAGSFSEASIRGMFSGAVDDALMARCLRRAEAIFPVLRACLAGRVPACPTMIVWGAEDRHTPVRAAEALKRQIPQGRLALIEHAGHLPQLESPAGFLDVLRAFEC